MSERMEEAHEDDLEQSGMETPVEEGTGAEGYDDFANLSDEEFLNHVPGGSQEAAHGSEEAGAGAGLKEGEEEGGEEEAGKEEDPASGDPKAEEAQTGGTEGDNEAKAPAAPGLESKAEAPDYEALYKQLMAPFKANGREFTPSSPEELVRLAQMGANYTKKMQALKPNLQLMRMLENNGLLDESKLSHLIDIAKGNPAAIQKLLHDTKVDPLDLDTSAAPNYTPGNHRVSDEEMQFQEVMADVTATETGKDTVIHIDKTWDLASKKAVFKEPQVLSIINEHRATGIYDQICGEIERQQMLGEIPSNVPFINAYMAVGSRLQAEGKFTPKPASTGPAQTNTGTVAVPRQILETRAAQPRKVVSNGDRAKAASPGPKASSKESHRSFDPFSMTDEEIMAIPAPPMMR